MRYSAPLETDPLDDPRHLHDACLGAVLLSDQIEYYMRELELPLLQNADKTIVSDDELTLADWWSGLGPLGDGY